MWAGGGAPPYLFHPHYLLITREIVTRTTGPGGHSSRHWVCKAWVYSTHRHILAGHMPLLPHHHGLYIAEQHTMYTNLEPFLQLVQVHHAPFISSELHRLTPGEDPAHYSSFSSDEVLKWQPQRLKSLLYPGNAVQQEHLMTSKTTMPRGA